MLNNNDANYIQNDNIIDDTIHILPCLQERRQLKVNMPTLHASELEQEPAKIIYHEDTNKYETQPLTSKSVMNIFSHGSSEFNKEWNNNNNNKNTDNKITNPIIIQTQETQLGGGVLTDDIREKLLTIYSDKNNKFNQLCRKTKNKWDLYGNYLINQLDNTKNHKIAIVVAHHNRLKGLKKSDTNEALIPFYENSPCKAYANNFCLKIQLIKHTNGNISFDKKIINYGNPDKTDKLYCGKYENDVNYINTDILETQLRNVMTKNENTKTITIYLVRHGNAFHNEPFKIKHKEQLTRDSMLTPYGMFQATQLGETIRDNINYDNNEFEKSTQTEEISKVETIKPNGQSRKIYLWCSFLMRTHMTGLCIMKSMGLLTNMQRCYNIYLQLLMQRMKIAIDNKLIKYNLYDDNIKKIMNDYKNNLIVDNNNKYFIDCMFRDKEYNDDEDSIIRKLFKIYFIIKFHTKKASNDDTNNEKNIDEQNKEEQNIENEVSFFRELMLPQNKNHSDDNLLNRYIRYIKTYYNYNNNQQCMNLKELGESKENNIQLHPAQNRFNNLWKDGGNMKKTHKKIKNKKIRNKQSSKKGQHRNNKSRNKTISKRNKFKSIKNNSKK